TDNYLECIYRGAMPELPERELTPLDISKVANADFSAKGAEGVPGWMGGPVGNDIADFPTGKQEYEHIPFDIINPAKNGRKACIGLSGANGYQKSVELPVNRKLGSIYLLHNYSGGNYAGKLTWNYADETESTYYVLPGQDLSGFSFPKSKKKEGWPVENRYIYKVAWTGKNHRDQPVGVYICGLDNPHPEREVKSLTFAGPDTNQKWMISGITLSDKPHFFMPPHVSYGAPDAWAAAAVTYALIEGLAGVKDKGVAFDKAVIAPRWNAAGVKKAKTHIKYEASGGYVAYDYQKSNGQIRLDFTSNAGNSTVEILLDANETVKQVKLNSQEVSFETKKVEGSRYLVIEINRVGVYRLEVELG
ncbi:MAG: hypothetical protein KDE26_12305, partial [Bacteroidetes bacterium]|nr:hypothetical protein [Bacteroidota bacterium]